jgi:hypothetical protein
MVILQPNYSGSVKLQLLKVSDMYDYEDIVRLKNRKIYEGSVVVSDNINIGGWKYVYLTCGNLSLKLVLCDDIYESVDDNKPVYIVRFI